MYPKTIQNTMVNLEFISEGKVTTPKHSVLKLSNHFEVTCMSGMHWWYRWSCYIPSDVSVCGEYPSDKLKVPLSVQDTSETSVSDTDSSLATIAGLTYTENRPIHGILILKKKKITLQKANAWRLKKIPLLCHSNINQVLFKP